MLTLVLFTSEVRAEANGRQIGAMSSVQMLYLYIALNRDLGVKVKVAIALTYSELWVVTERTRLLKQVAEISFLVASCVDAP